MTTQVGWYSSRIASYLLTPVIDCGVLLSSGHGGQLVGIDGRVTVLVPGAACLVCRNRIDLQRAAAEMLNPSEYRRLAEEGYAPALLDPEPAVVAFTTQVASAAVGEQLERLIHYGPDPVPTEILLRSHEREVSTNDQFPHEGHYCHPQAHKTWAWRHRTLPGADMAGMKRLIAWWQSLPLPWRPWRIVGQIGAGDEVAERLPHRGVVLVGTRESATWAVFDCPCRTGTSTYGESGQSPTPILEDRVSNTAVDPS